MLLFITNIRIERGISHESKYERDDASGTDSSK